MATATVEAPREEAYTVEEARHFFLPTRRDKPVHRLTVTKYITRGVLTPDGRRIFLKAQRHPSGWRVTRQAVAEFVDALTEAYAPDPSEG